MIGRVCGALLVLVACARSRAALETDAASIREGGDSVFVEVVNDNYYDARIHVVYDGGGRFTLGTVPGNQRQPVRAIPWQPRPLVAQVSLIIGGGTYQSDRIDAAPGAVIEIRVPPNLRESGFFRRIAP